VALSIARGFFRLVLPEPVIHQIIVVEPPRFLIADEPTTALDTKNQAAILRLFKRIREAYHTAILFVSHDEHQHHL
jgi:ABC-type dipeptide/oligopeptide/nickel transport system ATPase component